MERSNKPRKKGRMVYTFVMETVLVLAINALAINIVVGFDAALDHNLSVLLWQMFLAFINIYTFRTSFNLLINNNET